MMEKTRGLTLGKFAPLHKGHQLMIDTALAEMDELLVIVYDCPETTSVPLNVRSSWLKRLYPQVRVIEAWDGPTEVGDTPAIRKRHEAYVLNQLNLNGITHFWRYGFAERTYNNWVFRQELKMLDSILTDTIPAKSKQ